MKCLLPVLLSCLLTARAEAEADPQFPGSAWHLQPAATSYTSATVPGRFSYVVNTVHPGSMPAPAMDAEEGEDAVAPLLPAYRHPLPGLHGYPRAYNNYRSFFPGYNGYNGYNGFATGKTSRNDKNL